MKCHVVAARDKKGDYLTLYVGSDLIEVKKVYKESVLKKQYLGVFLLIDSKKKKVTGEGHHFDSMAKIEFMNKRAEAKSPTKKKKAAKKED